MPHNIQLMGEKDELPKRKASRKTIINHSISFSFLIHFYIFSFADEFLYIFFCSLFSLCVSFNSFVDKSMNAGHKWSNRFNQKKGGWKGDGI